MSDTLEERNYANWMKVPELVRQDCLNALRDWIPSKVVETWRRQHEAGEPIGGPGFHLLGGGMQIRNRLRTQLLDEELPPIDYTQLPDHEDGPKDVRNWDDYYLGALQELTEQTKRAP